MESIDEKSDRSATFEIGVEARGECSATGGRNFIEKDDKLEKILQIRDEHTSTSHQYSKTNSEWEPNETPLYSELQDSDELRLLHLQPGLRGEMIKCTMKHTKLSEKIEYEALSYVWGPDHIVQPIVINECTVHVRQNLWLAMQHLRSDTEVRVLWVDATCIDQQNIHERNHQVTQMGMIYHQATRVIVWLGTSDADSKLTFDILSSPAKWTEFLRTPDAYDPSKRLGRDSQLKAVSSFFSREYWTRLWIIQEFLMARDFALVCGDDTCSGFRFSWFMELLDGLTFMRLTPTQINEALIKGINHSIPARLCQLRKTSDLNSFKKEKRNFSDARSIFAPQALFGMFLEYNTSKCEDQRDRVFGFHSLAQACCKNAIPIDYSLTWETILGKLVRHQITSHYSLPESVKSDPDTALMHFREFHLKAMRFLNKTENNNVTLALDELELISQSFTNWERKGYNPPQSVELRIYARGIVCYTSPPLAKLDLSKDCLILPKITPMVELQMRYICSLNGNRKSCHPYATTEIDRVGLPFPYVELNELKSTLATIKSLAKNHIPYWGCNVNKHNEDEDIKSSFAKNFRHLLYDAQKSFSRSGLILAFEENGLIFLASNETKVGDLLCQFQGTDVLAVISTSSEYEYHVRRAMNFLASPYNMATDIGDKPMSFTEAEKYAIGFNATPGRYKKVL